MKYSEMGSGWNGAKPYLSPRTEYETSKMPVAESLLMGALLRKNLSGIKKKAPNPKKIPVTMADLEKAKKEAQLLAMQCTMALFLRVLLDKEHATLEDIQRVGSEVNDLAKAVSDGEVSWADVFHSLEQEDNIEV